MTTTFEAGLVGVVDDVARPATTIDESTSFGEAWSRLHVDPDRCGVVLRGHVPIAVITAGDLAERWPGGGPLASFTLPVVEALVRPVGVETLAPSLPLIHAGRLLLASGCPALPVTGGVAELRVLTLQGLLAAALGERPRGEAFGGRH